MKTTSIIYICFAVFGLSSFALLDSKLEAEEALNKINEFYASHKSVYHEFEYNLYPTAESTELHSTEIGSTIITEEISYAQLGYIESISTIDFTTAVDHEEKVVIISNVINPTAQSPSEMVGAYLEMASTVSVATLGNSQSMIECTMEFGQVEKSQIIFDSESYQLEKIISFYRNEMPLDLENEEDVSTWTKPRLEVNYTYTLTNSEKDNLLDASRIVKQEKGEWKLTSDYKDYELMNNILELDSAK